MDRAWVRAHPGRNGGRVEDRQAPAGPGGGAPHMIEYYTLAGLAAVSAGAALVGFRLAKDEMLLRRKKLLAA